MTMVYSVPALINVGSLLFLVVFIYAVLGMNLFPYVMQGDNVTPERNFESFSAAMLLLFQQLTGDGWSGVMDDLMVSPERGCDHAAKATAWAPPSDCGTLLALPYFFSFQIIGGMVFINLIVGVIIENFSMIGKQSPDLVSSNDIQSFKEQWALYDPDANNAIPATDLPELILSLEHPLGLKGKPGSDRRSATRYCLKLSLSQDAAGEIHFRDVLDALIAANFKENLEEGLPGGESQAAQGVIDQRRASLSRLPLDADAPMTDRQKGLARGFANRLLAMAVQRYKERKKRQSLDPNRPPSPDIKQPGGRPGGGSGGKAGNRPGAGAAAAGGGGTPPTAGKHPRAATRAAPSNNSNSNGYTAEQEAALGAATAKGAAAAKAAEEKAAAARVVAAKEAAAQEAAAAAAIGAAAQARNQRREATAEAAEAAAAAAAAAYLGAAPPAVAGPDVSLLPPKKG
jgi:hypothetical protein